MEKTTWLKEIFATSIPDIEDDALALEWVFKQLCSIELMDFTGHTAADIVSIVATDVDIDPVPGIMASPQGRRFALAVLLADWACYRDGANKESYAHLQTVLSVFPSGFRIWLYGLESGVYLPVGYSGWHPIPESVFVTLHDNPERLASREAMTPRDSSGLGTDPIYIFNFSIIPQLQRTAASKLLIKTLASDLDQIEKSGLAAITVSPDGQRIAKRFGLHHTGSLWHEGHLQEAFAWDKARDAV